MVIDRDEHNPGCFNGIIENFYCTSTHAFLVDSIHIAYRAKRES